MNTIEGNIKITRGGAGYVDREDLPDGKAGADSIRIDNEKLSTALNGDKVLISTNGDPKVLKILERAKSKFTGTTESDGNKWFVVPDDKKIHLDFFIKGAPKDLKNNQKVLVEMTGWNNPDRNPEAKILEIIGKKGEHEAEMRSIVLNKGVDIEFPAEVEREAEKINQEITEKEIAKRRDMRNITTFTIDPLTAKDFDDALSFEILPNGNYEIGVHIADVSHYVREGTALDKEAQKRSFSVYLVDRTIPMLPEILSNGVCSLNPNEDKLTFSAVFEFDKSGKKQRHWIGKTVINSNKRFTYENAQEVLNNKSGEFYKELSIMDDFANKMNSGRVKRGSILFERDEVEIEIDKEGKPIRISKKKRIDTQKLIEEFMLLANREVTEHIEKHCKEKDIEQVFVYRVHDIPNEERLQELSIFLKAFGYDLNVDGEVDPKDLNKLIKEVEGKPEEELVKTSLIRSMAKAAYSTKNIGHFGLAFKFYTSFTSPIRRYPDVLVHRLLEAHLKDEPVSRKELQKYQAFSITASEQEINAAEAERESKRYKMVEFMLDKVDQEFPAVISGVADWGLYVSLSETGVEGLVRLASMKDDFYKSTSKYAIQGQRNKKKFQLGDEVKVRLTRADLDNKELDFVFV
jgi:ribonuclease R